jgi:hypothetical protein
MLVASLKYPYHPKKIFTVFELRSYNQLIPMAIMEDKKYHSITQVYETLLLAPNTVRKWEKTCELLKPSRHRVSGNKIYRAQDIYIL